MPPSYFFFFPLLVSLLLLHKGALSEDDLPGFNGDERDALLALKAGFNNTFLNANWSAGIMCYMNDTPYWHGIQCSEGRVTAIILDSIGLVGEIKVDALLNLTELLNLSFKNNSISGNMMDFSHNHKLRSIDLSSNSFDGEISSSITKLNSLESLHLQSNNFSGPIPEFNQPTLKAFNVSYNNLSGTIPRTRTLVSFNFSSYYGNKYLCGPPSPTFCNTREDVSEAPSGSSSSNRERFGAIVVVVDVIVLVVIVFLFIIYYRKYKKLKMEMKANNLLPKDEDHDSRIVERATEKRIVEGERGNLVFVEEMGTPMFDLDDLLKASAEGLGKGSFGSCYKAMLETGPEVVVKRLRDLKPLNMDEFVRQVRAIADQKHPNLLPLLAYYYSKDEKLFLFKVASNGNLYHHLHEARGTRERVPFRWSSRLTVARGVARALNHLHLHTRSQTTVPHGNLKSTNVLLHGDEILVSDYGLTSLIALPIAAQRMTSYKCPEYLSHKSISKKSDVWSYGSLVLELLTGRIPAHSAPPGTSGVDLCSWVHRAVREEWTAEIFDPEISVQRGANKGMLRLMQIAIKCSDKLPEKRPEIGQVLAEVEEIKSAGDSEDEENSYSSFDRSLTDESLSATTSL